MSEINQWHYHLLFSACKHLIAWADHNNFYNMPKSLRYAVGIARQAIKQIEGVGK